MLERPVHIGLSPDTANDDVLLSLEMLCQPWLWQKGERICQIEQWFKNYFNTNFAISFNSGRSALLAILTCLQLPAGSQGLTQAFTCVAVPNSIIWAGLRPIFVDIDKSLNINVADAQKKITAKTKVLILQHTFGIPANIEKIADFCRKNKLIMIEDCAHALGASYQAKQLGTFGDAAFFSFG